MTVYEASAGVGGLAGTTSLGGVEVDRYYHALTLTDHRALALAEELGLSESIRWRPLGVGFFHDGRLASMSTPRELLGFPGLSVTDRARLVAFVARCRMISRSFRAGRRADRGLGPAGGRRAALGATLAAAARLEVRRRV